MKSDKTLLGMNSAAHLRGIGLEINKARNIIIRNMIISHVTPQDAIEINDARNIWIDHCELYSDRINEPDYYDGLLEGTNNKIKVLKRKMYGFRDFEFSN